MAEVAVPSKAAMPMVAGTIEALKPRRWVVIDEDLEMEPHGSDARAKPSMANCASPSTCSPLSSGPVSPGSDGRQHTQRTTHNRSALEMNIAVSRRVEDLNPSATRQTGRAAGEESCTCPAPSKVPRPCNCEFLASLYHQQNLSHTACVPRGSQWP
jgi:hypothetical protein